MELLESFFMGTSLWVYLFIFFGKIIEVSIATVRIVLISRGERLAGSIVALFEVLLWIVVTGTVLANFQKDIVKVAVFIVAFAIGNYIGSWLENKLAIGLCSIHVITPENKEYGHLVDRLRSENFGVTILDGKGKDGDRKLLIVHLRRKRIRQCMRIIEENIDAPVVTISDVKSVRGGYLKK